MLKPFEQLPCTPSHSNTDAGEIAQGVCRQLFHEQDEPLLHPHLDKEEGCGGCGDAPHDQRAGLIFGKPLPDVVALRVGSGVITPGIQAPQGFQREPGKGPPRGGGEVGEGRSVRGWQLMVSSFDGRAEHQTANNILSRGDIGRQCACASGMLRKGGAHQRHILASLRPGRRL